MKVNVCTNKQNWSKPANYVFPLIQVGVRVALAMYAMECFLELFRMVSVGNCICKLTLLPRKNWKTLFNLVAMEISLSSPQDGSFFVLFWNFQYTSDCIEKEFLEKKQNP